MNKAALPCILLATLIASCEEKPSAKPAAPPPASPPPAKAAPPPTPSGSVAVPPATPAVSAQPTVSALGLAFPVPDGWKSVPPANSMRLAELQVPDPAGDAGKACAVVISTAGGDVQANLDRWAGQVKDASGQPSKPAVATRTVAGMKVHVVGLVGAFSAGMGDSTVHENWMLHGAIVETPRGLLFIKMTGPAGPMAAAGPAFNQMIDGLTPS